MAQKELLYLVFLVNMCMFFGFHFFPVGKKVFSECQHCKKVLKTKEMSNDFKQEYKIIKSDSKVPIWQFSGLILIILVFLWGVFDSIS